MLYGATAWDPVLIIAQIAALQCLFYLTLGVLQAVMLASTVGSLSAMHLFEWQLLGVHTLTGWLAVGANLGTALLGAVYLMWIVERAKRCLDFASTVYLLHFVFVWAAGRSFPLSLVWWGTNACGLLLMALLGEWLCVRREMADIPLSSLRTRGGRDTTSAAGASSASASGSPGGAARTGSSSAGPSQPRASIASQSKRPPSRERGGDVERDPLLMEMGQMGLPVSSSAGSVGGLGGASASSSGAQATRFLAESRLQGRSSLNGGLDNS
ncbi:hypothetical protein FOA52_015045 [Chlamydomonas sp. UWO 241]|nr:hypothetical protein FOA52_015045 [Chlamydomonas sp. UWO 241]